MPSIVSYRPVTDAYTTYRLLLPTDGAGQPLGTEIAEIDGVVYVALPDGAILPAQHPHITVETVVLTQALADALKAASAHVDLIHRRVIERIREAYSIEDELGILRAGSGLEFETYYNHVETSLAWGRQQKVGLGLPAESSSDRADIDALPRQIKAAMLVVMGYCNALRAGTYPAGGKSIADVKADFRGAWESLA